jgi:hypothetical protein
MDTSFVVAYAEISHDRTQGVKLKQVCFGGIGDTQIQADEIARSVVNSMKNITVVPKSFPLSKDQNLMDVMMGAQERFEAIVRNMAEADTIVSRRRT